MKEGAGVRATRQSGTALTVLILSLAVRLLPVPFIGSLSARAEQAGFASDGAVVYSRLADALVHRSEFGFQPGQHSVSFVPFYPLLLAALARIVPDSRAAILISQAVLGAGLLFMVFVWTGNQMGVRVGLIAAGLAALVPDFAVFSYLNLSENLALLFVMMALIAFDAARRAGMDRRWLLAGAALGFAALTREFSLSLIAPLAAAGFVSLPFRGALRGILWMTAGCLLVILPWTMRNWRASGEFVLLTDKGMGNLYLGTVMGRYHPSDPRRHWTIEDPAEAEVDRALQTALAQAGSIAARDALYRQAAWRNLRAAPLAELRYAARKAATFWEANIGLRHRDRIGHPLLLFSAQVLYGAVVAAAVMTLLSRSISMRDALVPFLFVAWTFLFHVVIGEAEPRYHFMCLPGLFAIAARGGDRALQAIRTRRRGARGVAGAGMDGS